MSATTEDFKAAEGALEQENAVRRFSLRWTQGGPPDLRQFLSEAGELSPADLAAILRLDLQKRWQAGERVPAEDYLRGDLVGTSNAEVAVDVIYQEFVVRGELGEKPSVEEYQHRFPEIAVQIGRQIAFDRALAAGDTQNPTEALDTQRLTDTVKTPLSETDRQFSGYELLEEIARGGMGVVYKARHIKLNRLVALKMILGGQLASAEQVRRFHFEAEAAANLKHPNIVPIYEVGEHEGRHFYAMGYVEGESLAALLSEGPLPCRDAAVLMKKIAEAVEYAHRQGVIHRDLKPSNILIDASGEPHVTDFGLAKRLESDSQLTATGAVLGTPSYMSPEQARGDVKAIGPRSDVYGLGTVLYSMLTGKPPFLSSEVHETLRQVREDEPRPLRTGNPAVPRDLETICFKCLAKELLDRYASAAQLVEDLNCFLDEQPLLHARRAAWPVRLASSLARAVRRRPWRAVYIKLSLVAFALLAAMLVKSWIDHRGQFDRLLDSARAEEQRAEEFWQQGRTHDAQDHYSRARDVYASLVTEFAAGRDLFNVHLQLCHVHTQRGILLLRLRLWQAAEEEFERARQLLTDLPEDHPEQARRQLQLAEVFHNLGVLQNNRGTSDCRKKALEYYELGRQVRAELLKQDGGNRDYRRDLARSYGYLGDTQLALGMESQAWDSYDEALQLREGLARKREDLEAQYQLGRSKGNTGRYWEWLGKPEKALAAYRDQHAYLTNLPPHEPLAAFQTDLANCCLELARLELDSSQAPAEEARRLLEQALTVYERLLAASPQDRTLLSLRARATTELGKYHVRQGDAKAAEQTLRGAVRDLEDRLREPPVLADDRYYLAAASALLNQAASLAGQSPEDDGLALRELERAVADGFHNVARLLHDYAFRDLHEKPRFKSLIQKIHHERATAGSK
jgi:serine/threonine-protein kinase